MSVTVRLPGPLRVAAGGSKTIDVEARSLAGFRRELRERHPALASLVLDGDGFASAISVFIDGEDARFVADDADLTEARAIDLLPAMSGG